jgi:tRNA dimethylallyltransferase
VQADRERRALIVAGPTASGKSALALAIAQRVGGTVINADSMQIYRELRILTARPTEAEEALAPHAVYGVRPAGEPGSVAWWRREALVAMEAARAAGRLPILCGGTGLYLAALTGGLAEIPDPGVPAREEARALLAEIGPAALHACLMTVDPQTARRLRPSDGQRLARAWEVWRGTGFGLAAWQTRSPGTDPGWCFKAIRLDPLRADLRTAIADRFSAMLVEGALAEVSALHALDLDPRLPAMRAHGVAQLVAHLRGEMTLADATQRAVLATGRYVKRQTTWFRHHDLVHPERSCTITARVTPCTQFSEVFWGSLKRFVHDSS